MDRNFPSVNDLISSVTIPFDSIKFDTIEGKGWTLFSVFGAVARDPEWNKVLSPYFRHAGRCEEAISDSFGGDKHLVSILDGCYKLRDWRPLFERGGHLWKDNPPSRMSSHFFDNIPPPLEYFKCAFENDYVAPYPRILLDTMDKYMPAASSTSNYYNRSFPIVQSSCMGKSRMVDNSAKLRFTFPFNLHEDMTPGTWAYPPFDYNVRDYLTFPGHSEISGKTRHYAFLEALFSKAVDALKEYPKGTPEDIALRWYKWMDEGSTITTVGKNRTAFYNQVIKNAKQFEESDFGELKPQPGNTLKFHQQRLQSAASNFVTRLRELHNEEAQGFLAVVYFDEAHTLYKDRGHNPYFSLMDVLNTLVDHQIFFIFISTNSNLNTFTSQIRWGLRLIPPFFELPFDCFCTNFTTEAKEAGKLTLNGVCELRQVVKFGRSIWSAYFQALSEQKKKSVIEFAKLKMESGKHGRLAALACRILLQFDPWQIESCTAQADLVKSHMRVVFNASEDQDYMWSGYPSEPMLAEAAGWLLEQESKVAVECWGMPVKTHAQKVRSYIRFIPRILGEALECGFLARGKRGELVIQTLFTVAHDLAIMKRYPKVPEAELRFHRPIKLLELLENLCSDECWKVAKLASPCEALPGDPTLEQAFENAWVNFSHFVQLGDSPSFNLKFFSELLKRGAAVQAFNNHPGWNGAVPLSFGDPATTTIGYDNTSALLVRNKYGNMDTQLSSELGSLGDTNLNDLPVLSIVFQLGDDKNSSDACITVNTQATNPNIPAENVPKEKSSSGIKRHHYMITLYGTTSKTYKCIPEDTKLYSGLLWPTRLFDTFLRADSSPNRDAFYGLKSMMYDQAGIRMPWA